MLYNLKLDEADYRRCQADFLTWATVDSRDRLAAGNDVTVTSRAFRDDLLNTPIPARINLLSTVAKEIDPTYIPPIRLPNPVVWAMGAEAYIQTAKQNPDHFASYPIEGVDRLISAGQELQDFLSRLSRSSSGTANSVMVEGMFGLYDRSFKQFSDLLTGFQTEVIRVDGAGVDPWGGVTQKSAFVPSALNEPVEFKLQDSRRHVMLNPTVLGTIPKAAVLAEQLGLGRLTFELEAHFVNIQEQQGFSASTAQMQFTLIGRLDNDIVLKRVATGPRDNRCQACPGEIKDYAVRHFEGLWARKGGISDQLSLPASDASSTEKTIPGAINRATARVTQRLLNLRREYYARPLRELSGATPLKSALESVNAAKAIIELYVAFAFPKSLLTNEDLRGAFGTDG